tara:strand:- start:1281 stop:1682 length:402 start_codon:yes stop_codon:yes gene_type:complete
VYFSIEYNGRSYSEMTEESAKEAGIPDEAIVEAKKLVRIGLVKAECRRRIYAEASAETQMNMATAGAFISSKTASARSEEDKTVLAGIEASLAWVAQMRGRVTELADDATLDIADDANWPPLPDGARDVVDKF